MLEPDLSGEKSRNFRGFFHSGMASHSWGKKGRMEDWFVGHKGEVVKGRLNVAEGRLMFGEVLIGWSW